MTLPPRRDRREYGPDDLYPERAAAGVDQDLADQINRCYREAYLRERLHPCDARREDAERNRHLFIAGVCLLACVAVLIVAAVVA